jgi:hypothetical protein
MGFEPTTTGATINQSSKEQQFEQKNTKKAFPSWEFWEYFAYAVGFWRWSADTIRAVLKSCALVAGTQ